MNDALMIKSIQDYLAAWNAQTSSERQSLLQSCMTDNAIYIDPHAPDPVQGVDEMQALIEKFRSRFDHKLEPEGQVDLHHNIFRLRWRLQRDSSEILSRGLMVGDLNDAGEIERIVQFVDAAPVTEM
jgi:ketosteroid isomerase-like protein